MDNIFNNEENKRMIVEFCNGNTSLREKIILNNMRLVSLIVPEIKNVDKREIMQIGAIGLINAVDTYDITKGIEFSTYAGTCIRYEIYKSIKKSIAITLQNEIIKFIEEYYKETGEKPTKSEISEKLGIDEKRVDYLMHMNFTPRSIYESLSSEEDANMTLLDIMPSDINVEEEVLNKEMVETLLSTLPDKNRMIVQMYYGINCPQRTLQEIANLFNVTRAAIDLIVLKSCKKMWSVAITAPKLMTKRDKTGIIKK